MRINEALSVSEDIEKASDELEFELANVNGHYADLTNARSTKFEF